MIELTDDSFKEEVLEADLPVLVDFWAPWCAPCRLADPVLNQLAKDYQGKVKFGKLNVDENTQMAQEYGVMSIPTVVMFNKGEEVKREVGFLGKEGYENFIKSGLGS